MLPRSGAAPRGDSSRDVENTRADADAPGGAGAAPAASPQVRQRLACGHGGAARAPAAPGGPDQRALQAARPGLPARPAETFNIIPVSLHTGRLSDREEDRTRTVQ